MMTSIKKTLLSAAAAAALAISSGAFAASQADFDAAYSAADAELKKAVSMGNAWRDTGKMLKKAKKAAAEGNFAKAISIARDAQFQAQAAQEQAASQANAGNPGYLY